MQNRSRLRAGFLIDRLETKTFLKYLMISKLDFSELQRLAVALKKNAYWTTNDASVWKKPSLVRHGISLRADVSYFFCFTREAKEIGDVCTQNTSLFAWYIHTYFRHRVAKQRMNRNFNSMVSLSHQNKLWHCRNSKCDDRALFHSLLMTN